jgi:dephospho-CoA kinase
VKSVQSHTQSNRESTSGRSIVLRVGVTGGIGSGKSAVCSILRGFGIQIIEADSIARILMVRDPIIRHRIIADFGSHVYQTDGTLNRQAMAHTIFIDPEKRKHLEEIVHPRVIKEIDRFFNDINSAPYAIVEAALIYESGLEDSLDYTIVVDADERRRIERIHDRDGLAFEDVRQRMRAQMSAQEKRRRADIVIGNNGTLEELQGQVAFIHTLLSGLKQRPRVSGGEN